jgi:uncharacterized protein YfiM (DUF2279 family)
MGALRNANCPPVARDAWAGRLHHFHPGSTVDLSAIGKDLTVRNDRHARKARIWILHL